MRKIVKKIGRNSFGFSSLSNARTFAQDVVWPYLVFFAAANSLANIAFGFAATLEAILFAAVGMVLTFCYLCQLAPFVRKDHFNLRSTDDMFVMALECTDKTNDAEAISFLQGLGASDVQIQYKETGWWLGRYDKDTKRFERKEEAVH